MRILPAVPQVRCAYCTSKYSCRHGSTSRNLGSDECDVETDRQTTPRLDRSHGVAYCSAASPTSLASEMCLGVGIGTYGLIARTGHPLPLPDAAIPAPWPDVDEDADTAA